MSSTDHHAAAEAPLVVVISAGSRARSRALGAMLGGPGFRIAAEVATPEETEAAVERFRPAALLLDTELDAGGLETIERVMASAPTPIVVCGAAAVDPQTALGAGAVDIVGPRDGPSTSPEYVVALRRHLHFASRVRVITHPRGRLRRAVAVTGAAAAAATAPHTVPLALPVPAQLAAGPLAGSPASVTAATALRRIGDAWPHVAPEPPLPLSAAPAAAPQQAAAVRPKPPAGASPPTGLPPAAGGRPGRPLTVVPGAEAAVPCRSAGVELVVIGASTGGPPALATILGGLPRDFTAPILVVQHMADGFVEGLAEWLQSVTAFPVAVGFDGLRLKPGSVTLAPAGSNVIVHRGLRLGLVPPLRGQFHVPGIDATFTSVAESLAGRAIGVLLTGMGRDGAAGLRRMRESGAVTIGQDEATSIVYGMPAAARALDAVELELALPNVAATLVQLLDRPAPPHRGGP